MTEDGWKYLYDDCKDFLYALKIIADREDKTCLLPKQAQTHLRRCNNVARIRIRARELFERVHEPIVNMLNTLRKRM